MSSDPETRDGFGPYLAGVGPTYKDQNGTVQTIRYGHIEDFERALNHFGKNVAAFLLEPIQGEAGYVRSQTCVLPLSHEGSKRCRSTRGVYPGSSQAVHGKKCSSYMRRNPNGRSAYPPRRCRMLIIDT